MTHDAMVPVTVAKKSRFQKTIVLATLKILKGCYLISNKISCFGLKIKNKNIALSG